MIAAADPGKLRIAFLGSANWDLIARDFVPRWTKAMGSPAEIVPVPFGQYRTMLWDEGSAIRQGGLDVAVFCERLEDFFETGASLLDAAVRQSLAERITAYLECLTAARPFVPGVFLVMDLAPVRPFVAALEDSAYAPESVRGFVQTQNARLLAACESLPDCHLVRLSALVENFGARHADPGKYWQVGRVPYSLAFGATVNECILATMLCRRGKTIRLIVTDLDNTLWGGIVGEDGFKGIKLGSDFPGNLFVEFQRCLRTFKELGIALAICSRNTETTALHAIARHPNMILRPDDFVATRINWGDKAENIRSIAEEVGLGLSSVCFLDDSPYERDLVRRLLPQVFVPDLPTDPSDWPASLTRSPFLSNLRITAEDRGRAERYRIRSQIGKEAAGFKNRADYWRSLKMAVHCHQLSDQNLQRVLQLLAKTNQFNLTTRRHQELDLRRLEQQGARIVPIGLADKFSAHEIVGLLIILLPQDRQLPATLETFLLSCRVLGRSVETAVLGWACAFAGKSGFRQLRGMFVPTDRNQPARNLYRDHGFAESDGDFVLQLTPNAVVIPDYFEILED